MTVKLRTEHHLEFLSLKRGCTGSSEATLVKISNCWKSHAAAHFKVNRGSSHVIALFVLLMCQTVIQTHVLLNQDILPSPLENNVDPEQLDS